MKRIFIKTAMAAAIPLLFASCDKHMPEVPVQGEEGKKVDITLSTVQSKTYLENDQKVYWENGDEVRINNGWYGVTVDENDKSVAKVLDVWESSEGYFAMYPTNCFEDWDEYGNKFAAVYFEPQQEYNWTNGGFGRTSNPMVAYSESTNLQFHNLGSVIKLGVTGEGRTLTTLSLSGNDGETMAGYATLYLSDIQQGLFNYNFDAELYGSTYESTSIYFGESGLALSAEPSYIYVVVPAAVYGKGFTVTMSDSEGNVCIKKTEKSFEAVRSDIKQMATFEFEPNVQPLTIRNITPSATSVRFGAMGQADAAMTYEVVSKEYWDWCIKVEEGIMTEEEISKDLLASSYNTYDSPVLDSDGITNISAMQARCFDARSLLRADTDYILLSSYVQDGNIIGAVNINTFRTQSASGSVPNLNISRVEATDGESWNTVKMNIGSDANVGIMYYSGTLEDIERAKADYEVSEDVDLVLRAGYSITAIDEEFRNNPVLSIFENYINMDYRLMVLAISEGGKETFTSVDYTVSYMPDATWTEISAEAVFNCGLFYEFNYNGYWYGVGDDFLIEGLTLEKMDGADIFRIKNLFSVARSYQLADLGFIDKEGDYYTYFDATNPDYVKVHKCANDMGLSFDGIDAIYYGRQYSEGEENWESPENFGIYDSEDGTISISYNVYWSSIGWGNNVGCWWIPMKSVLYFDESSRSMNMEGFEMEDEKTPW